MKPFKFFNNNNDNIPITMNDISQAIGLGREAYSSGNNIEDNPYHTPELYEAFEEGWDYEHSLDLLRQARDSANNGL